MLNNVGQDITELYNRKYVIVEARDYVRVYQFVKVIKNFPPIIFQYKGTEIIAVFKLKKWHSAKGNFF